MCLYCEHLWLAGIVVQIITCKFFDIASHSIVTVMFLRVSTGPYFSNAEEVKSQEKDCSKLSLWLTDIYNGTECLYMHGRWIIAKKNSGNKWIPNLSVRIKIVTRKSPRTPCFNIYNKKFCWWTLYRLSSKRTEFCRLLWSLKRRTQSQSLQHIVTLYDIPTFLTQSTSQIYVFFSGSDKISLSVFSINCIGCLCCARVLPRNEIISWSHLTLPLSIRACNSLWAPIFDFSLSANFFISISSCLQFSTWALWNSLTKSNRVDTTCSKGQRAGSSPK